MDLHIDCDFYQFESIAMLLEHRQQKSTARAVQHPDSLENAQV